MQKYELGQSEIGTINEKQRNIVLNLQLQDNGYCNNALICGYITNSCGKPIKNVKVSFYNHQGKQIGDAYTSDEGFYAYLGVRLNSIIVICFVKKGYKKQISSFLLVCLTLNKYNVYLKRTQRSGKTIICNNMIQVEEILLMVIFICLFKKLFFSILSKK